jgi:hypothetical protein
MSALMSVGIGLLCDASRAPRYETPVASLSFSDW